MNGIATRTGSYRAIDLSLEDIMAELYKVSFPDIICSEREGLFWAQATMRIKVQGAVFKVSSEHGHKTPKDAAAELLERVNNAIKHFDRGV